MIEFSNALVTWNLSFCPRLPYTAYHLSRLQPYASILANGGELVKLFSGVHIWVTVRSQRPACSAPQGGRLTLETARMVPWVVS
jgi:hypothetical protein